MKEEEGESRKNQASNFARYSGIAIQMLVVIGLFAFIGYKIDEYRQTEKSIFTAILGLVGVGISLYQVVRSLNRG